MERKDGTGMIEGVRLKQLITHADERGWFRELIRANDEFFAEGFGQWSVSLMHQGVIKAWHFHRRQTDWWYVGQGVLKAVLKDTRADSPTQGELMELILGDVRPAAILKIPPGVAHGCKCLAGPVLLYYVTSHTYDPADEGRIPYDDPALGYDWLRGPAIT